MADSYKLNGQPWKKNITGHEWVEPDQLLANPLNARIHNKLQQDATAGLLNEVGWVKSIQVNQRTGHILDGHLRVTLALRKGEPVPVEYVDIDEADEAKALASLDYLVGMADYDKELLDALLKEVNTGDEALQAMLAELAVEVGVIPPDNPLTHWRGMPEFEQEDKTAFQSVHIHFCDQKAIDAFAELIGQKITSHTRSLWYPAIEIERYADKRYSDES